MPRCPQNPGRRCPARGLSLWGASGCICSGTKGSQTHRWRGTDSNHRYQEDKRPLRDGLCLASVTVPVPEGIHFFGYGGPMVRIHSPPPERCYGAGGEDGNFVAYINRWSAAMPQPNDLSRSLVALDQDSTIIAVVEMSQSSWLVGGIL